MSEPRLNLEQLYQLWQAMCGHLTDKDYEAMEAAGYFELPKEKDHD